MRLASKYPNLAHGAVSKAYADVIEWRAIYQIPIPWLTIVTNALDFVREYYPGYKITGFDIRGGRYGASSNALELQFMPPLGNQFRLDKNQYPTTPRPLRMLNKRVDQLASKTCWECGHKISSKTAHGWCELCECKNLAFLKNGG